MLELKTGSTATTTEPRQDRLSTIYSSQHLKDSILCSLSQFSINDCLISVCEKTVVWNINNAHTDLRTVGKCTASHHLWTLTQSHTDAFYNVCTGSAELSLGPAAHHWS